MKVCIEKSPDGSFSVYQENEASEQQNAQPVRGIQSALMFAGKLLSQEQKPTGDSPFDEGLKSVLPQRPGMM